MIEPVEIKQFIAPKADTVIERLEDLLGQRGVLLAREDSRDSAGRRGFALQSHRPARWSFLDEDAVAALLGWIAVNDVLDDDGGRQESVRLFLNPGRTPITLTEWNEITAQVWFEQEDELGSPVLPALPARHDTLAGLKPGCKVLVLRPIRAFGGIQLHIDGMVATLEAINPIAPDDTEGHPTGFIRLLQPLQLPNPNRNGKKTAIHLPRQRIRLDHLMLIPDESRAND